MGFYWEIDNLPVAGFVSSRFLRVSLKEKYEPGYNRIRNPLIVKMETRKKWTIALKINKIYVFRQIRMINIWKYRSPLESKTLQSLRNERLVFRSRYSDTSMRANSRYLYRKSSEPKLIGMPGLGSW